MIEQHKHEVSEARQMLKKINLVLLSSEKSDDKEKEREKEREDLPKDKVHLSKWVFTCFFYFLLLHGWK